MAKYLSVIDTGIIGVEDDNTNEGVIRTKLVQGELIKIPLHVLDIIPNSNNVQILQNTSWNADGSGFGLNLFTNIGLSNIAFVSFLLKGKIIGIRYRNRVTTPPLSPFTIVVDGVPYTVKGRKLKYYLDNNAQTTVNPERESVFFIDGLEDIEHTVKIIIHQSATETRSLVITGVVAEKRLGYQEHQRMDFFWGQGTITTSYTNIANTTTDIYNTPIKGIKEIWYYNTDVNPQIIYIQYNSRLLVKKTIAAGDTYIFQVSDTGIMVGFDSTGLQHKSDSNLIQFTLKSRM